MDKKEFIAYLHTVEIMARMAYWYNAPSKHCGADMSDNCMNCQHYNFCVESVRADRIHDKWLASIR